MSEGSVSIAQSQSLKHDIVADGDSVMLLLLLFVGQGVSEMSRMLIIIITEGHGVAAAIAMMSVWRPSWSVSRMAVPHSMCPA